MNDPRPPPYDLGNIGKMDPVKKNMLMGVWCNFFWHSFLFFVFYMYFSNQWGDGLDVKVCLANTDPDQMLPITYSSTQEMENLQSDVNIENETEKMGSLVTYGLYWFGFMACLQTLSLLAVHCDCVTSLTGLIAFGSIRGCLALGDVAFYITAAVKRFSHTGRVCSGDFLTMDQADKGYEDYINKSLSNTLWYFATMGRIVMWIFACYCGLLILAMIVAFCKQMLRNKSYLDEDMFAR